MDGATTADLLARLEAMAARLDEQATEIAAVKTENAGLKAQVARLAAPATERRAVGPAAESRVKRRGMLRKVLGATAAAALLTVAKEPPRSEANHDGTMNLHLGRSDNTSTGTTAISHTTVSSPGLRVRVAVNGTSLGSRESNADGIQATTVGIGNAAVSGTADAGAHGVYGTAWGSGGGFGVKGTLFTDGPFPSSTAGVWGTARDTNGVIGTSTKWSGVIGIAGAAGPGLGAPYGVVGTSDQSVGVFGSSTGNIGVRALSASSYGMYGRSSNGVGILGESTSLEGVWGISANGIGVRASSTNLYAVYGRSQSGAAVVGQSTGNSGILGISDTGLAGEFVGNVFVTGTLTAASKSAVVRHPDGTDRRLYCHETPEPWFEDFGRAELRNGQATVALDPDFDAVVRGDNYLVYLTPVEVECSLYVSRIGPHRFEVRSVGGAAKEGTFHYRVVARRKDMEGPRFEKVKLGLLRRSADLRVPPEPKRPEDPNPTDPHGTPGSR